jgi:hypothetical protein
VLSEAVQKIRGIADPRTQKKYAEALASSLRFDTSGPDEQDSFSLVIRRKKIKDFVRRYGKHLRASDVTRLFKTEAYEDFFKKLVPRCGKKTRLSPTVYTYAQALQRAGVQEQIALPEDVQSLFTDLGIMFP